MYTVTINWIEKEANKNLDIGENINKKEFSTIEDIKHFVYSLHDRYYWMGGSNWNKALSKVHRDSKLVGLISYNGKVWTGENFDKELLG